jgi:tRNA 2-selenouridine synthase
MEQAPMAVVEQSMDERVDVVIEDYVLDLGQRYAQLHGKQGPALHAQKLQDDLSRVKKRLGGERHQLVSGIMAAAFEEQRRSGDLAGHREWIAYLLEKYYDPMYEYQLDQRKGRQIFHGTREQVLDWTKTRATASAEAKG